MNQRSAIARHSAAFTTASLSVEALELRVVLIAPVINNTLNV